MHGIEERQERRKETEVLAEADALKELHRKLKGSLLQLESLMIALDIRFKAL